MKKNFLFLLILLGTSFLLMVLFYIFQGNRSILFRISSFSVLILIIINGLFFRKHLFQRFQRGKLARVKILESFAVLFFGIALLGLIKSFDLNVDWTEKGLFRLSKETKNVISNLDKPVEIILFMYNNPEDPFIGTIAYGRKLAERYEAVRPSMIRFKIVDPIRNKSMANEYGVRENGTFVFEMDGQREYVMPNLLEEKFANSDIDYKGETIFTAVIDKLLQKKETVVYYLTGHGELDFVSGGASGYNGLKTMLTDRRYTVQALNLDHHPKVPDETDILIIADPRSEFSAQVYQSIENYIQNGGAVLYVVSQATSEDLNVILFQSGFMFLQNVAVDPSLVAKNSGEFSIIPLLSPKSEITIQLRNKNLGVLLPSASLIGILPNEYLNTNLMYDIDILAKVSKNGFGERDFKLSKYQKDDNDINEDFSVALSSIVAKKANPKEQSRAVIFGSVDFIDNQRLNVGGNSQLFLNSIDFLLRKDLNTVVPPKSHTRSLSVPKSPQENRLLFVFTLIWFFIWLFLASFILIVRENRVKKK